MNHFSQSTISKVNSSAWKAFLGSMLLAGSICAVHAQGEIASGTVAGSGTGPYTYSLTFSDAANATSPIGSVWYAWVPGGFFLPSAPTTVSAPPGWTATPSGKSIQFVASSATDYITAGHSLSGFGFTASFSPSQLTAAPNSGKSVAYSAGLFAPADPNGFTFTVQPAPVPEPSPLMLISAAAGLLVVLRWRISTQN
jgi:hypothetical protein